MSQQSEFERETNSNFEKIFNKEQTMTTSDTKAQTQDDVAKENKAARDQAAAAREEQAKKPQSSADEIAHRVKFSPTVRAFVEKLIKVASPLDTEGQPNVKDIAAALVTMSKNLRASQKDGWKSGDDKHNEATAVKLDDPKPAYAAARPLLIGLGNRLAGLYVLSESFDAGRAQALTPLIEEVSEALASVAGAMDEKSESKFNSVFEKAGITEQKAADRLT